jgi:hypothetical protein
MIEEVDSLAPVTLQAAYQQARDWLADSQNREVLSRLNAAGGKLADSLCREMSRDEAVDVLLTKPLDLDQRLLKCEHETIQQALAQTNGSVALAAPLIGRTPQGLSHMIEAKHPDLLKKRTPIHRRRGRKNASRPK